MSRVGKMPIPVPDDVDVKIDGDNIKVSGPKGLLSKSIIGNIDIKQEKGQLFVMALDDSRQTRAFYGLVRSLVNNMVVGVTQGFKKALQIVGVGYRAEAKGDRLILTVGYSHPVEFILPKGISAKVSKEGVIEIEGINKELVGDVAARIRKIRPPDAYKGKGIRYLGEQIKLKPGKSAAAKA
ncbi:MAG: 50S ribosomal protein L6 [Deltaproteobacteria bacterium]|nr:50S ribosomal protein L6 [Deltaproteobacteria bacterium]